MFQVLATIQGLGLVVGLLAFLWWRDGGRWRRLAAAYPVPAQPGVVHDTRRRRTVILRSRGGLWNRYLGTVTVDISEWGVTLRLMAPWAAFHPPVFVPAAEVVMQPSSWYLIGESWALTLPRVPDLSIIVTEDDWFSPSPTVEGSDLAGPPTQLLGPGRRTTGVTEGPPATGARDAVE